MEAYRIASILKIDLVSFGSVPIQLHRYTHTLGESFPELQFGRGLVFILKAAYLAVRAIS